MKKRLLCLLLCFLMVASVCLTGCSKKDKEVEDESESPVTLTLRLISEKKVYTDEELQAALESGELVEGTPEYRNALSTKTAYESVTEAINVITKAKYKTKLVIKYYTEDEYYEALDDALNKMKVAEEAAIEAEKKAKRSALKKGETYVKASNKKKGEETIIVNGIEETKYPDVADYQLDIFYLNGYDNYKKYIEYYVDAKGNKSSALANLDNYLEDAGKKLLSSVSPALLDGVKYNGVTYAIPNNNALGEYTYMVVDKGLFDKYLYNPEDVTNILDLENFLSDVDNYEDDDSLVLIDSDPLTCLNHLVYYWNIDPDDLSIVEDEFSIIGHVYGDTSVNRGDILLSFDSLFSETRYQNIFLQIMDYKYRNYFGDTSTADNLKPVVSFVTGDQIVKEQLEEDNYVFVAQYPTVTDSDIYSNMFCVAAGSSDISKSMSLLAFLNTDPAVRNLLQYGIEGDNYQVTAQGIKRLNDYYMMDLSKTGNEFVAYPEEGMDINIWDTYKTQNREALVSPTFGFNYDEYKPLTAEDTDDETLIGTSLIDLKLIRWLKSINQQIWEEINACQTYEEVEALVSTYNIMFNVAGEDYGDKIIKLTVANYDAADMGDEDGEAPYRIYYSWLSQSGYLPEGYMAFS